MNVVEYAPISRAFNCVVELQLYIVFEVSNVYTVVFVPAMFLTLIILPGKLFGLGR